MNREKGVSSLALVLMLLVLGSLLLQGMSQQDRSFASRVSMESQSLRRRAIVQSALAWGKMHSCRRSPQFSARSTLEPMPGFVCVYWQIMKPYWLPVMKAFRCGEQAKSLMETLFFATRLERFLSAEREGVMSASLKNQQGFSLPEVMVAMVLMVMIVTALSGIQRTLMNSLASRNQYQQLWRHGWQQTQLRAISPPANWQVNRMQTSQAGCVSISVTLVSPGAEKAR